MSCMEPSPMTRAPTAKSKSAHNGQRLFWSVVRETANVLGHVLLWSVCIASVWLLACVASLLWMVLHG